MLSRINNIPNIEESFLPTYDVASLRNCFATFRINIVVSSSGRMNDRQTNSSWTFRSLKDETTVIRNVG